MEANLDEDNSLEFTRRVIKSGNRTVRAILDFSGDTARTQEFLKELTDLQCSYEGMHSTLISINVPPAVDLDKVTDFLTEQDGIKWEYCDPTYEEVTGTE